MLTGTIAEMIKFTEVFLFLAKSSVVFLSVRLIFVGKKAMRERNANIMATITRIMLTNITELSLKKRICSVIFGCHKVEPN